MSRLTVWSLLLAAFMCGWLLGQAGQSPPPLEEVSVNWVWSMSHEHGDLGRKRYMRKKVVDR